MSLYFGVNMLFAAHASFSPWRKWVASPVFFRFLGKSLCTGQKLPYWEPTGEIPWFKFLMVFIGKPRSDLHWRFLGKYLGTEQKLPYWEPTGENPWISRPEYIRTLIR